jgi:hypothetical protein
MTLETRARWAGATAEQTTTTTTTTAPATTSDLLAAQLNYPTFSNSPSLLG